MNDQLQPHIEYQTRIVTLPVRTLNMLHTLSIERKESLSGIIERLVWEEVRRKKESKKV